MKKAYEYISNALSSNEFEKCIFSSPRTKSTEVRTILINSVKVLSDLKIELRLQKHNDIKTVKKSELIKNDLAMYLESYKQCLVKSGTTQTQILINKKGVSKIIEKSLETKTLDTKHNKDKNYLIPDGEPCGFLEQIGVMDSKGRVKSNFYKKFRQINRFLEMVDDLYKDESIENFHAVDFGCGKSYLTFALYHYFVNIKKVKAKITGIDLKQEVIDHCNHVAQSVGFDGLVFAHGFIHDFKTDDPVDFVVTLHACDTATDDAILFSLRNKASKMMFVPCCQHELNKQIQNNDSDILLKHGIFRDQMTALVTDTMRSQLLEACGFKVQSMEFISSEHTAKNILLRCTKVQRSEDQNLERLVKYNNFKKQWNIKPYLEQKLFEENFLG